MKDRLPGVLETIAPSAWHTIVRLAPAELVNEVPTPLAYVRDGEVFHVQEPLAFIGVLFDVQEVRTVIREHRFDPGRHIAIPRDVLIRRYWAEAAGGVVLA